MIADKRVMVVGLGISGEAAALFLHQRGAAVKVTENNDNPQVQERLNSLKERKIEYEIGGHTEDFLKETELMVTSPGVEDSSLPIVWAQKKKVPIISEVELGYLFYEGTIVAISGTNGKSTVTSVIGEIFKKAGRDTHLCGNIGLPFVSIIPRTNKESIAVLEISSFQLERIERFKPHIAIMLNITEDHLDRYKSFDDYAAAKKNLFINQDNTDYAILNLDQPRLRNILGPLKSKVLYFSKHKLPKKDEGAYVENNELVIRRENKYTWLASKESLSLSGEHNLENALASGLAAHLLSVDADIIKDALSNFKGLKHRFELVDVINGIKFVDDSKATNVDSVKRALQSSPKGIILIAGGKDKGGDYKVLIKALKEKVKSMLLIGEAKEKIAAELSDTVPISFAPTLEEAVGTAFKSAKRGETVLLSPICSSFDMFKDYKERGDVFRKAVMGLKGGA